MWCRWVWAVIRSARFNSALPPSATRTRIASAPERCDENRLDGVKAVLGLIEHDAGRGLEHIAGDFQARGHPGLFHHLTAHRGVGVVERRQAVHELHLAVTGLR